MSRKGTHPKVICQCQVCGKNFHPPKSSVGPDLQVFPGLGKYCSHTCSGIGRRKPKATLEERFWSKVNKNGPIPSHCPELGECWVWIAAGNGAGYGLIGGSRFQSGRLAHRISYEWEFGPIPEGLFVLHRCDNRACIRPSHLFLGDETINAKDMISKGKNSHLYDPAKIRRGEDKPNAILTEEKVREIRHRKNAGESASKIAKAMNLNRGTVSNVYYNKWWTHVS